MQDSTETFAAYASNRVYSTKQMFDSREITEFMRLEAGEYIIIPYTYESNKTASFILSLCSKTETHAGYAQAFTI